MPSHPRPALALLPLLLGAGLAASALAAKPPPAASAPTDALLAPPGLRDPAGSRLVQADRLFVERAAQSGMAEIALGRLASERGQQTQVKAYGNTLVHDHGSANQELMRIAHAKGVQLGSSLNTVHQRDAERLSALRGAQFDRAFMAHRVDAHRKTLADFEQAMRSLQDDELKSFVARTLPTLQQHLQHAQNTLDGLAKAPAAAASR